MMLDCYIIFKLNALSQVRDAKKHCDCRPVFTLVTAESLIGTPHWARLSRCLFAPEIKQNIIKEQKTRTASLFA